MFLATFTLKLIAVHLWIGPGINCIKLLGLAVPDQVRVNDTVELRCLYDLEGEAELYSLSWTFNGRDNKSSAGREFYRYVPRDSPRKQHYSLPYFKLHMHDSHEGIIRLTMLSRNASGIYKCEVSTENTFRTLSSIKQIQVVNGALWRWRRPSSDLLFVLLFLVGLIARNSLFATKL